MSGLTLSKVLGALNPLQPPNAAVAGITLYVIAVLTLIGLFMQKEGSTRDTIFLSIVLLGCLIDKIATTSTLMNQITGFTQTSFGIFIMRTLMFTLPLVVAGSTKAPKSRGVLIGAGALSAIYLFARWFFEIRPQ
jgi:hypothetical protein